MKSTELTNNLLIISDLHLGEDIKPGNKTGYLRHIILLEKELTAFLDHYAATRIDDQPWRLVINGDMVDFLSVVLLPRAGEVDTVAAEDHVYGLGTRPRAAGAKMQRVLERHSGVFQALARFIGAGNRVEVIVGNHDMEFHWPIVQDTFRKGVSGYWIASEKSRAEGSPSSVDIEAAISFHPWFFFEEGVVWVEHGHQYDDYCSFDYVLNPTQPKQEEIVLNVGAAGMRYVSNLASYAGQQEEWSFVDYLRWTFNQGMSGTWRIARGFYLMVTRTLSMWRMFGADPEAVEERRLAHREKLAELAARVKLDEQTLVAVDELRRRPIVTNLAKLIMALMLDRLAVAVATTLLVLIFVVAMPWRWAVGGVAGLLSVATLGNWWLAHAREIIDSTEKQKAAGRRIRDRVRAPFVVMGHSHHPVALDLGEGGWYFNTGTWVPAEKPGLIKAFTHLLIQRRGGQPVASLCQWLDGESRAFVPDRK